MGLTLDESTKEDDKVTSNGIAIVYAKDEEQFYNNSVIDFEDSFLGKGFTIRSSAPSTCC